MDKVYPVGSIYMSVNSTDPGTLFGGTWERLKDCFLLSAGDTYTAGATGGEAKHTLTDSELPALSGELTSIPTGSGTEASGVFGESTTDNTWLTGSDSASSRPFRNITFSAGGGTAHNNMMPYMAVYVYKRIA